MTAPDQAANRPPAAFLATFLFSLCVSGSLVSARLVHGPSVVSWLWSLAVTLGAAALVARSRGFGRDPLGLSSRAQRVPSFLGAQLLAGAAAIALIHWAALHLAAGTGLAETPAQLVNDGVLIAALLGLVWCFTARSPIARAVLPVASFALVAAYAATRAAWHVDPFPGFPVQSYVVGQVLATAAALFGCYVVQPGQGYGR